MVAAAALWLGVSTAAGETVVQGERSTDAETTIDPTWGFLESLLARGSVAVAGDPADAVIALSDAFESAAALLGPANHWPVALRPLPRLVVDPVKGSLSSPYGYRQDPINKRQHHKHHNGIDFDAERGDDVRAAGSGIVIKAGRYYGYGRVVFIDHGQGMVTRYGHLQTIGVKQGEYVTASSLIGTVGSSGRATGPHLHFEVRIDGKPVDPALVMHTSLVPGVPRMLDFLTMLTHPGNPAEFRKSNADYDEI